MCRHTAGSALAESHGRVFGRSERCRWSAPGTAKAHVERRGDTRARFVELRSPVAQRRRCPHSRSAVGNPERESEVLARLERRVATDVPDALDLNQSGREVTLCFTIHRSDRRKHDTAPLAALHFHGNEMSHRSSQANPRTMPNATKRCPAAATAALVQALAVAGCWLW